MIALVLCGGQSTRMGSDKGLLQPNAKTWAATAADIIMEQGLPVQFSVNNNQLEYYSQFLPSKDLIVDNETLAVHGPLIGLLSAHLKYPNKNILVLACDMPLMQSSLIKELITACKQHAHFDAWLYKSNAHPEPLCAIYSSNALASILQLLKDGKLYKHSMKFMLEQINPFYIPVQEEQEKCFRNFNSHAELNGL
jgi:molybdopterin-guanine dinucleotide biosynthesis protein A